jgi:hypothetical protein
MELTGGVHSSNQWGEVVVGRLVGPVGKIERPGGISSNQWGEVVVGRLVGPVGKIERPGGISPKNRLSSRVGSISVRGAIGLRCV